MADSGPLVYGTLRIGLEYMTSLACLLGSVVGQSSPEGLKIGACSSLLRCSYRSIHAQTDSPSVYYNSSYSVIVLSSDSVEIVNQN